MTLGEAIDRLEALDPELKICARRPWTEASECVVVPPAEDWGVPRSVKDQGFAYFMGVGTAVDAISTFRQQGSSAEKLRRILIYYAEHDGYPEWAYDSENDLSGSDE